jgi:hypothetical protein
MNTIENLRNYAEKLAQASPSDFGAKDKLPQDYYEKLLVEIYKYWDKSNPALGTVMVNNQLKSVVLEIDEQNWMRGKRKACGVFGKLAAILDSSSHGILLRILLIAGITLLGLLLGGGGTLFGYLMAGKVITKFIIMAGAVVGVGTGASFGAATWNRLHFASEALASNFPKCEKDGLDESPATHIPITSEIPGRTSKYATVEMQSVTQNEQEDGARVSDEKVYRLLTTHKQ